MTVTARAPGKAILFGEHAINRGQPALAVSVGLYATCRLSESDGPAYHFRGGGRDATAIREDLLALARTIDRARETADYATIRRLAAEDFFAPSKYVVASALGADLPRGLALEFESEIPPSCGLGSGGGVFAALARALAAYTGLDMSTPEGCERLADWAHRGDIIAHGGIASRLDSQTSLTGGVIRFQATGPQSTGGLAELVAPAPRLTLVIGNTGVRGATSEVNARVRAWLAERPEARMHFFRAIGTLSRAAVEPLRAGDWPQLGSLMTLNHVLLEKIGVSSPELDTLVEAALGAGAHGAKLAGSGGGGVMIALCAPDTAPVIADAITRAGGTALTPALAVPGTYVL